jgi:EAL domain-containing protein (putative c-di-GMP-specific phosphodiesterase class I)
VYQPILGLRGRGNREMYELLLRLVAPGGQLVSPTAFLPVADRFGLMVELDQWVIRRACEELSRLHAGGRAATFFVNLSGYVFENSDTLARTVSEELARHGLSGENLVFEITEQVAVRHLQQARRVIEALGVLGCRFALDDFGSGFSSLNYLKNLPAAFLKISGAFVQNVVDDALDEVMVRSIVQIADALGMQTVAESVEDRQTLQHVAELGVNFAQGHAIARPSETLPDAELFTSSRRFQRLGRASRVRGASSQVTVAASLRKH